MGTTAAVPSQGRVVAVAPPQGRLHTHLRRRRAFETIDIVVYDEDYNSPMSFEKDDLLGTARIYVDQVRAPTSVSAADSTHQSALLLSRSARALVGSSGTRCAEERRSRLMSPSMTVRRCPLWRRFP